MNEKPEKAGWYVTKTKSDRIDHAFFNGEKWVRAYYGKIPEHTYWFKPLEGAIPMTEEQLKEIWEAGRDYESGMDATYFNEYIKRFKQ